MDRGGQGGPRDAQEDVHPPRQPGHRGAVDAESCLFPQIETNKQHIRQARTGEWPRRSSGLNFYCPGRPPIFQFVFASSVIASDDLTLLLILNILFLALLKHHLLMATYPSKEINVF